MEVELSLKGFLKLMFNHQCLLLFMTPTSSRLPCPSPSPRICPSSRPLNQQCHPNISCSVSSFSPCHKSFPASGSFPVSWLFASGGQSIGPSASVLPMNIQDLFPLGLTGLISCCPRDSQKSCPTPQFKNISSLALSLLYGPAFTSIHDYWKHHIFNQTSLCQQSNISAF